MTREHAALTDLCDLARADAQAFAVARDEAARETDEALASALRHTAAGKATEHKLLNIEAAWKGARDLAEQRAERVAELEHALRTLRQSIEDAVAQMTAARYRPDLSRALEMARAALGQGEPLCSICRGRHGTEVQHACE